METTKALLIHAAKFHRYKRLSIWMRAFVFFCVHLFIDHQNNVTKRFNEERSRPQPQMNLEASKRHQNENVGLRYNRFDFPEIQLYSSFRSLDRILCISFKWTVACELMQMFWYPGLIHRATHSIVLLFRNKLV